LAYKTPKSFIKVAKKPSENQSKSCSKTAACEEEHGQCPIFDFLKTFSDLPPWGTSLMMMWELREMSPPQGPCPREGDTSQQPPNSFYDWLRIEVFKKNLLLGADFRNEQSWCDRIQSYY